MASLDQFLCDRFYRQLRVCTDLLKQGDKIKIAQYYKPNTQPRSIKNARIIPCQKYEKVQQSPIIHWSVLSDNTTEV